MLKKLLIVLFILILGLGILFLKIYYQAGEMNKLQVHSDWNCQKTANAPGSEDIVIDPSTGIAYISSFDRREHMKGKPINGRIFTLDLTKESAALKPLIQDLAFEFKPHGIDFYQEDDGTKRLFVVNHKKNGHYIEIFKLDGDSYSHQSSIKGDLMTSPNDLAAVGPKQFYVTNDHGSTSDFGRTLEEYLQLSRAYVLYFDGKSFKKAAEDFSFANGIAFDKKRNRIFVASTLGRYVKVFNRDRSTGSLREINKIDVDTGADNIDIAEDATVWIAAHPKMLTFVRHAIDDSVKSPSQALVLTAKGNKDYGIRESYLDSGEEISGSSVIVSYKNKALIGSVFENHILLCTKKK